MLFSSVSEWLTSAGDKGWPLLVALIATLVTFRLLRYTGNQFKAVTAGHEAFDFLNRLTVQQIFGQLPDYTEQSRRVYTLFFVVDFFFPLIASIFLALLWTALFRYTDVPLFKSLLTLSVPLFPLCVALFDWGENVSFLVLIQRYPLRSNFIARVGVVFKRLKLITLFGSAIATWIFIGIAVLVRVIGWIQPIVK